MVSRSATDATARETTARASTPSSQAAAGGGRGTLTAGLQALAWVALGVAGCATPAPLGAAADAVMADVPPSVGSASPFPSAAVGPALAPSALLTRLSIDLRGTLPSAAERARLAAGDAEAALAALTESFLRDERFGARVADQWAEVLRTRVEDFPVGAEALGLPADDAPALAAAIGEEPLQLLARVAQDDRPWTELVTADWTMTNDLLAAVWPVTPDAPGPGWRPAHYDDGRPPAGLLSTNGLWWRYLSDGVNYGRGRANALARIFLCSDFLDRPVDFPRDLDLTDEEGIRAAVRQNTGCVGCHAALDPLASFLSGLQYAGKTAAELSEYHPEREGGWRDGTGLAPAFYGTPGYTLSDLGRALAGDPRFVQCAVRRTWELLLRRPLREDDAGERDALTRHREAFLAGGLTLRALVRSIVADPRYREAPDPSSGRGEKLLPPEVWAQAVEDLTGFRLREGGADLLATDRTGLRTLAGGGDGRAGSAPATAPTATMALVWQRVAEAAAAYAVAHWDGGDLFERDPSQPAVGDPGADPALQAQAIALHQRLFGHTVAPDSLEVSATLGLWADLAAMDGPAAAWAGVLSALLRDPDLLVY